MTKALEKWLAGERFRQCKIWWHNRYDGEESEHRGAEIWWHCELSEHSFPGLADYGQRKQAGAWKKTEVVYTGYDRCLSVAIRKALKRARIEGRESGDAGING